MESAKQATLANQIDSSQSSQHETTPNAPANRILSHTTPADNNAATGQPSAANHSAENSLAGQSSLSPSAGSQVAGTASIAAELTDQQKAIEILQIAADAFASNGNWVVFYRDMLGVNGLVHRTFDTEAKFEQFQATSQYAELQEMIAALRSQDTSKGDAVEAEKMITIRLPDSLHKVLTAEAESMNLSINKLCISKLLQPVEGRFVPVQQGRRRGRRPGPQGSRKSGSSQTSQG